MYYIKWLNFINNSDLLVAKSYILVTISAVLNGGNGEWSVEVGAVGPPSCLGCPSDYLSSAQRLAAWNPAHSWLLDSL